MGELEERWTVGRGAESFGDYYVRSLWNSDETTLAAFRPDFTRAFVLRRLRPRTCSLPLLHRFSRLYG